MIADSAHPHRGMTPYPSPNGWPRFLSDVIIELGLAGEDDVNQAVEDARQSHANVGQILVRQGRLSDDDLARALAARYGLNYVDLNEFEVDHEAANLLPPEVAKRCAAVPVAFVPHGSLLVAMADPSDSLALSDIEFMTHLDVQPAVAAANLIADLASRLPLPPNEPDGSRLHIVTAATAPAQPAEPPATQLASTPHPGPSVGDLSSQAASDEHRAELDALRAQQHAMRSEIEALRADRDAARSELDAARGELESVRSALEAKCAELERATSEMQANRDAAERAAEAERRVAELEDVERRAAEAHSIVEKMRTEFELEREGYAAAERGLRGRLASETEQYKALQVAHEAQQTRAEALSAQNARLLDACATAKNWSAEFARGARELASALENAELDGAAHAEPAPGQDTLEGFTPSSAAAQPSNEGDALPTTN